MGKRLSDEEKTKKAGEKAETTRIKREKEEETLRIKREKEDEKVRIKREKEEENERINFAKKSIININTYAKNRGKREVEAEVKIKYNILKEEDGNTITKIIHMADIHIHLEQYHTEYNLLFNRLYMKLSKEKDRNPNSIIVVAGDIFQTKGRLNTNLQVLTYTFFENMSSIFPVMVIAGNHDCYEHQQNNIDTLTALFMHDTSKYYQGEYTSIRVNYDEKKKILPNVQYMRESGIYKYKNIIFGVSSILDKYMLKKSEIDNYIRINNLTDNNRNVKYIGLYHGMVRSTETPKLLERMFDEKTKKSKLPNITDFEGYDMTMLGDIHMHYYLDKNKRIAYASSLISHNYSEIDDDHGYILWDVESGESEYNRIENEYAFKIYDYEEYMTDGKIDIIKIEDKLRNVSRGNIKIKSNKDEVSEIELTILSETIQRIYPNILLNVEKVKTNKKFITSTMDITNMEHHPDYEIETYIDTKINMEIDMESAIREGIILLLKSKYTNVAEEQIEYYYNKILERRSNKIKEYKMSENWMIEMMFFDNLYTYGDGNVIDFNAYEKQSVIGILGENTYGKTSLLDIMMFALYGEPIRNVDTIESIVNKSKRGIYSRVKAQTGIIIKAGRDYYYIYRNIKFNVSTGKNRAALTEVKLYKMILKEEYTDLYGKIANEFTYRSKVYKMYDMTTEKTKNKTDEKKDSTIASIIKIIGTPSAFIKTSVLNGDNQLLKMSLTGKRDYFLDTFGINFFEDANKEYKAQLTIMKENEIGARKEVNKLTNQHSSIKETKRKTTKKKATEKEELITEEFVTEIITVETYINQANELENKMKENEEKLMKNENVTFLSEVLLELVNEIKIMTNTSLCTYISETYKKLYNNMNKNYKEIARLKEMPFGKNNNYDENINVIKRLIQQNTQMYKYLCVNKEQIQITGTYALSNIVDIMQAANELQNKREKYSFNKIEQHDTNDVTTSEQSPVKIEEINIHIKKMLLDRNKYTYKDVSLNMSIKQIQNRIVEIYQEIDNYKLLQIKINHIDEKILSLNNNIQTINNIVSDEVYDENENIINECNDKIKEIERELEENGIEKAKKKDQLELLGQISNKDYIISTYNNWINNKKECLTNEINMMKQLIQSKNKKIFIDGMNHINTITNCINGIINTNEISNDKIVDGYNELKGEMTKKVEIESNITLIDMTLQELIIKKEQIINTRADSQKKLIIYEEQTEVILKNEVIQNNINTLNTEKVELKGTVSDIEKEMTDKKMMIDSLNKTTQNIEHNVITKEKHIELDGTLLELEETRKQIQMNNSNEYEILQKRIFEKQSIDLKYDAIMKNAREMFDSYYINVTKDQYNKKTQMYNEILEEVIIVNNKNCELLENELQIELNNKQIADKMKVDLNSSETELNNTLDAKVHLDIQCNELLDTIYATYEKVAIKYFEEVKDEYSEKKIDIYYTRMYEYIDKQKEMLNRILKDNFRIYSDEKTSNDTMNMTLKKDVEIIRLQKAVKINEAKTLEDRLSVLSNIENNIQNLEILIMLTSDDGIEYILLDKYIQCYQDAINKYTRKYLNRSINITLNIPQVTEGEIETNNKSNKKIIKISIYNDILKQSVSLASGMESVAFDIFCRLALAEVTNIPRATILLIDEQISTFDQKHITSLPLLFNMMKPYYNSIYVITHVENAKSSFNYTIDINRDDNNQASYLSFNNIDIDYGHLIHPFPSSIHDDIVSAYNTYEHDHTDALRNRGYILDLSIPDIRPEDIYIPNNMREMFQYITDDNNINGITVS